MYDKIAYSYLKKCQQNIHQVMKLIKKNQNGMKNKVKIYN